jgi:hypothetical protein
MYRSASLSRRCVALIGTGKMAHAITGRLSTLRKFASEVVLALRDARSRRAEPPKDWRERMTLLDHVVLQVDDLNAIGDWYDQVVSLAGGARTFNTPTLIGYALPDQPAQLFFSLATDPDGRQTHLALKVKDETTVRLGHEFAVATGRRDTPRAAALAGVRTGLLRGVHPRPSREQPRTQVPSLNGTANARPNPARRKLNRPGSVEGVLV